MKTAFLASGALAALGLSSAASAVPAYSIAEIAPLPGDAFGSTSAVSPNGAFAAGFTQRSTSPAGSNAFLYDAATGLAAAASNPTFPSAHNFNQANGVNNSGVAVGVAATTAFGSGPLPTLYQNGVGAALPLPAGANAGRAYSIDNNGTAVGSVSGNGFGETAAVFTTAGSTLFPQTTQAGGRLVTAYGVSDSGRVVGQAVDPANAATNVPFLLDYGTNALSAIVIPNLPGKNGGFAFAVSSNGLVVGSNTFNGGAGVPFLYSDSGGTVAVPLPDGATSGGARGVNSLGQVVGTASTSFAVPYFFDGTQTFTLQSLISDPTWDLSMNTSSGAFGISDTGVIVGRGLHNGVISAFVLTPVPEPTTLGIAAVGGLALMRRRRA